MHIVESNHNNNVGNDNDTIHQLNRLAYAVSHDMGTPLRHVKGFTELLERDIEDKLDDRTESHLKHLKTATDKLDTMMEGVLRYSRIVTRGQPPRLINSSDIVAEAISEVMETRIKTPLISYHNLPKIDADPKQFKRLWQELISNAITYSKPNQLIDISITSHRAGDKWIFTIADKGMGIPTNITNRIFNMFYRGVLEKDYPEGNGIGLTLCEKIVQRHGGEIWCESAEDYGSRFHFTWPIYEWREKLEELNGENPEQS